MQQYSDSFFYNIHTLIINGLGDWASVIGVIIAIVGFIITIYNVLRSKSSTKKTEDAINKIRTDLTRMDIIFDCSTALSLIDQIKFLQRQKHWILLPDKYSILHKSLITIHKTDSELSDNQKSAIQSAIVNLRGIEKKVEEAVTSGYNNLDSVKFNTLLSKQIETLQDVLIDIKKRIGR